jgi:phospholipid N-methyltransferase
MPLTALRTFEERIERQLRLLELKKTIIERNIGRHVRLFERGIRLDDEVRFIRSWIERPLTIGALTPSGKMLARAMARYVDPHSDGPVVELGPGGRFRSAASDQAMRQRLRLIRDAFDLMLPGAPFVQFTYSVASPLPRRLSGFTVEASERIWMNIPPARVWVYRKN